jgi:hypothetical protein
MHGRMGSNPLKGRDSSIEKEGLGVAPSAQDVGQNTKTNGRRQPYSRLFWRFFLRTVRTSGATSGSLLGFGQLGMRSQFAKGARFLVVRGGSSAILQGLEITIAVVRRSKMRVRARGAPRRPGIRRRACTKLPPRRAALCHSLIFGWNDLSEERPVACFARPPKTPGVLLSPNSER